MTAAALGEHMAQVILGALGLTYLLAVILILARPPGWRMLTWLSQIAGFSVTCFLMGWVGLGKAFNDSLVLAVAGAGIGALAAWRWAGIAHWLRQLERTRRRQRRSAPGSSG